LILTSNRIQAIDEAFRSRISYAVPYADLDEEARRSIWTDFVSRTANKAELLEYVDDWAREKINGRQIRNVILNAETLSMVDPLSTPVLKRENIDTLLKATVDFNKYTLML
jgi:SpoVK/Ycf46/Vps4 family AAA+-type ATPase